MTSLETLNVSKYEKLHSILGLDQLTKLQTLDASRCCEIQELLGVEHLNSLDKLVAGKCWKLQNIPVLGKLTEAYRTRCWWMQ